MLRIGQIDRQFAALYDLWATFQILCFDDEGEIRNQLKPSAEIAGGDDAFQRERASQAPFGGREQLCGAMHMPRALRGLSDLKPMQDLSLKRGTKSLGRLYAI